MEKKHSLPKVFWVFLIIFVFVFIKAGIINNYKNNSLNKNSIKEFFSYFKSLKNISKGKSNREENNYFAYNFFNFYSHLNKEKNNLIGLKLSFKKGISLKEVVNIKLEGENLEKFELIDYYKNSLNFVIPVLVYPKNFNENLDIDFLLKLNICNKGENKKCFEKKFVLKHTLKSPKDIYEVSETIYSHEILLSIKK